MHLGTNIFQILSFLFLKPLKILAESISKRLHKKIKSKYFVGNLKTEPPITFPGMWETITEKMVGIGPVVLEIEEKY